MPQDDLDEILAYSELLVREQGEAARLARLHGREAVAAASAASDRAHLALMRAQKLTTSTEPPIPTHPPAH